MSKSVDRRNTHPPVEPANSIQKELSHNRLVFLVTGKVTRLMDFGAFVEVLPGIEGLCHVSELDVTRVNNPKDVVNEGDRIDVKLLETNERGQLKLSRREVLLDEGGDEARAQLEEAKQAREEARDARKAEAEGGAQSEDGGWGGDRGGGDPQDGPLNVRKPSASRLKTRENP